MPKIRTRRLVLLAEPDAIIAYATQLELEAAGYAVAGPFDSCVQAITWLDGGEPDFAILDVDLSDGTCVRLVAELSRLKIPFMLYTVNRESFNTHPELKGQVWLEKPAPPQVFLKTLATLAQPQVH